MLAIFFFFYFPYRVFKEKLILKVTTKKQSPINIFPPFTFSSTTTSKFNLSQVSNQINLHQVLIDIQ